MIADVQNELLARARAAAKHAYAPYSEFPVGAAALAADGSIYTGCNVENASYGLTICAERMALGAAVAAGARAFRRVAVTTEVEPPAAPCGACRQLLAEFGTNLEVVAAGPSTERRCTLGALLPDAFTKESLDR